MLTLVDRPSRCMTALPAFDGGCGATDRSWTLLLPLTAEQKAAHILS